MLRKAIFVIFLVSSLFFITHKVLSLECDQFSGQQKVTCLEQKVKDLGQVASTLNSEILRMNTQISLTTLQIQQTEDRIASTQKEIDILGSRIEGLDTSLNYLSKLLVERIADGYKKRNVSLLSIFFDSANAGDLFDRIKYLKTAQDNNQKILVQVQETKLNFEEQKKLREEKIKELDDLKITLDQQKNALENQQLAKRNLLAVTRNDEKVYQQRLADAQRELFQIQRAASVLQDAIPVQVKRGDSIGTQGNTGYSFGDHLHYGVYNYSSIEKISSNNWYYSNWVDPSEVLSSRTVKWDTDCEAASDRTVGNGSFDWPMDPSAISQGSGITCYSNIYYKGNPHPAWDMWGPIGTSIRASEEGKAYFCRNCLGDGGNGVFIFHSNGKMTLYWHLQ